jgi:hypothetical protein
VWLIVLNLLACSLIAFSTLRTPGAVTAPYILVFGIAISTFFLIIGFRQVTQSGSARIVPSTRQEARATGLSVKLFVWSTVGVVAITGVVTWLVTYLTVT